MSFANPSSERVTLCSVRYGPAGDRLEQQLTTAVLQNAASSHGCQVTVQTCNMQVQSSMNKCKCKPVEAEECIPGSTSASEQIAAAPGA